MDSGTGEIKMQQELTCNKHLPYYSKLKEEAIKYLREIKGNVSLSLLLSESNSMKWIDMINTFNELYGRYFSKDDHIYFIKLFLEVIIIPGFDLPKVRWFIPVLYDLLSATKEILDELRPYLCVYDTSASRRSTELLNVFLPTLMKPEDHDKGFKLWLEEFLTLWDTNQNTAPWEQNLVDLFSRLAEDSIGYIDWDPWIPKIFTHLLRSLIDSSRIEHMTRTFNVQATSRLIISLLGGPSSVAMSHVAKLFSALESYYHPSNIGEKDTELSQFLCVLSLKFINRISKERYQKKTWMPEIPSEYKLTDKEITEFVNILKPIILIHMFSRSSECSSAYAFQLLSTIRPELIIPPLIDKMYSSMENLTEPHRLISSLQCVFSVSRNMVISNKHYPEGQTHVIPLLFLALPGLDPNDIKKCMITFQFISTFVSLIPLVDCSSAVEFRKDLAQTEYDVCLATSQWEDFVFQFIERCFLLIENSSFEHRPERRESEAFRINSEEGMTELGLTSSFNSILNQCSPQIFERALDKVYCYLSNRIFEEKVSGKFAANICRCFTKVNPELTLKKFWPHFSKQVLHLTESDDVLHEDHLDQQLVFNLLVLSEIVRCDGHHLLNYKDSIVQ
ncbi:proteasome (prosome: macropain) activator subunit 4-like protein, partial [Dinothrombium tinctorium]